jgi:protein-L-isoaspartate O-methyltransferase
VKGLALNGLQEAVVRQPLEGFLAPSVESQVRPNDVADRRLLSAMCSIARKKFILEAKRSLAAMDEAIELES